MMYNTNNSIFGLVVKWKHGCLQNSYARVRFPPRPQRSDTKMFNKLTNFGYRRDKKEAVGFYVSYLVFIILLGAVIQGILSNLSLLTFELWSRLVRLFTTAITSFLVYKLLKEKKLLKNLNFLSFGLLSILLALSGWALIGLLIPAYFTTRKKES